MVRGSSVSPSPQVWQGSGGQDLSEDGRALAELATQLEELRDEMRRRHEMSAPAFARVRPQHRRSAENLVDYLTLRSHDMRPLQETLAQLGVSSLGRSEEHVIRSVEQVVDVLRSLAGDGRTHHTEGAVDFDEGRRLLRSNAVDLLGPEPAGRSTRIMVTMPGEAADDPSFVWGLLRAGMDCARVNCAHDGPDEWRRMVTNVRTAAQALGRTCQVLMDLPGPKLRTGPVAEGPKVVRLRPARDARGVPIAPAEAVLVPIGLGSSADADVTVVPVPLGWVRGLAPGDHIALRDARNDARKLEVTEVSHWGARVVAWDTTYVESGTLLEGPHGRAVVGRLPAVELYLRVRPGDVVTLTPDRAAVPSPPRPADATSAHFRIGCSLPEALRAARPGHRVWFDDGKVGGRVQAVHDDGNVDVEITAASPAGSKLRGGRGINLPDSDLQLSPLGADDTLLAFVAEHADMVGLSFAQRAEDVVELQRRLADLGRPDIGLVLKIETASGFERLPELVLAGMASERIGVMAARGDLAVECGFERLAEVQEEILWLCDAAHVPVIWATQVLDQMARTGRPSRAEVSDAVLAGRAECVMLNKGPHIGEVVVALDDILRRMETHQDKKVPLLRRLRSWSSE